MKISHLQEADITPSSGPDNMATGQAPKMGRSNDVLETTTSGSIATGEPSNLGTQRRGKQSIFKGIKTSKKFANSRAAGIYEDEISEEQLQAKKRREELFKRSKDRGIGKKPVSRDIMAKEAFNGEYDDEAGMADNNLETMRRAVDGIDDVIGAGDNLPEWCQEKIAVAKSMLVTVWDYMHSEEEIQHGKEVDEGEVYDLGREYGADAPTRRPLPSGGSIPRRHDDEPDFMDPDQRRLRAEQERLKKANAEYYAKKNQGVAEGMFGSSKESQILPLVNKISDLAGKLNSQNVEVGKKIIQSNTNDIVRMLNPQTKPGIDVIEGGIAQPKTDDNLRKYYADLKAKKQAEKDKQQGVAEGFNDDNFTIDDIHRLEQIKDFETLKARAKHLIKGKPARRMKPEKIAYFYDRVDTLTSPIKVIKMMYDLLLAGEGMKTIGSQNSTNPNFYQRRFTEEQQGVLEDTIDMPFGSISGKDVDIGLQHRSEQAAYSGLKKLGLVDTSEQFLTLQEIAKLVTDTSNIHIFAFDTNPVRSYVKLIKMIGWNKDNPTEYKYNQEGVQPEQVNEKSVSKAQFRTMAAVAHNPKFAKKVGISPKVGKEFHSADKKQNYKNLPTKMEAVVTNNKKRLVK